MSMDLTESIQPRSDQINADDLIPGPATYTIREVVAGKAEHPFDFQLVETDRAYRPSKTMRRVIVAAWGPDAAAYAGRRLTLYREPSITFGGQKVGGIRISHMSHIPGPVEVMAQTTRGKREKFTVQPLTEPSETTTMEVEGLPVDPVSLPTVTAQITSLSAQERADLYEMCGIPKGTKAPDVKALLIAKQDEINLPDSDPPDVHAILRRLRTVRRENKAADAADAFNHFAQTGHDLDEDPQTVLDA